MHASLALDGTPRPVAEELLWRLTQSKGILYKILLNSSVHVTWDTEHCSERAEQELARIREQLSLQGLSQIPLPDTLSGFEAVYLSNITLQDPHIRVDAERRMVDTVQRLA